MIDFAQKLASFHIEWRRSRRLAAITEILSKRETPDTSHAENTFEVLQKRYPRRSEYGYDRTSLFNRAAKRSIDLLSIANVGDRQLQVLDIGAGDGMLGVLLAAAGHEVTLCDLEDWRAGPARNLHFVMADCCVELPFEANSFDVVSTFNAFEHFADPKRTFCEIMRVMRRGGWGYFDFGPLYCSPWGLHAYSSLRMPYPQFLFSTAFLQNKLAELGVWDLGKRQDQLQYLNRWTPEKFAKLWSDSGPHESTCRRSLDFEHLDLVLEFPECFRGRGLSYEDVTCSNLTATVRKTHAD